MSIKEQTTYDLNSGKFKFLKRDERSDLYRVDIFELNKKLNESKKSNFYRTILIGAICFSALVILSLISIKF